MNAKKVNKNAVEVVSAPVQPNVNFNGKGKTLVAKVIARLRGANKALAKLGQPAVRGISAGCDLELAPP